MPPAPLFLPLRYKGIMHMVWVEEWMLSKSPKLILKECNSSLSSERYREGCYILKDLSRN